MKYIIEIQNYQVKNCRKFEVCLFVEQQKIDVKDKISFPYLRMILFLLLQFFRRGIAN